MSNPRLDHVPVGYFVLNEAGHIEDVNALGAELVGRPVNELVGRRFVELIAPNDTWRYLKHLREAAKTSGRRSCRLTLRGMGDERLTHLFTCAERTHAGAVARFHTAILTVAAELIEAKEEAERVSHMKTAFLANMSHEIRTPLTGIIGFASVLAKELPEEHREFAELIRGSGRRLLEMLNSVLDLAKLESNQMAFRKLELDAAAEIRRVVDLLAPVAAEKGLAMEFEEVGGPHLVYTDRAALNRILHNLIGNAIKFTDEGEVRVRISGDADQVTFEVIDTGIGVDPDFVPHLFDEFSQESSGMSRSHSGAGLGLAITKRLVNLMEGTIQVESVKSGGSRFRVSLPRDPDMPAGLQREREEAVDDSHHPYSVAPASRLRLLLVEDHGDTQQLLLELLEEDYHTSVAASASEGFLLACQKQFDLVLMDIDLGEGPDGTELLKQLRGLPEYADTPIVAVTAFALPGDRERFLEMGFTAYVSKPFDVDELMKLTSQLG